MDENKNNLDITVLTREYSSELERSIAVRNYLKEAMDGIQNDKTDRQRHIGGKYEDISF
jgi:hypothetical protein